MYDWNVDTMVFHNFDKFLLKAELRSHCNVNSCNPLYSFLAKNGMVEPLWRTSHVLGVAIIC
jgi:hypothetical protein